MMSIAYDYTSETAAAQFLRKPHQLLIDGKRVPSSSGRTFKSLNPATEQVIATVAEGNEADVDRAVAAARRAFEGPWRTMRPAERGHLLLKWAELLKQHADEIVEIESLDRRALRAELLGGAQRALVVGRRAQAAGDAEDLDVRHG